MALSDEDARALAFQQQQYKRAVNVHTAELRLHGDPAARIALLRAWEPVFHRDQPFYPGQYNDLPPAPPPPEPKI